MDAIFNALAPILNVLYAPLDWVLGWSSLFPPAIGIAIVGVVSGLGVTVLQKYASRQELLARCREDLRLLKERAKKAKASGDGATAARLQGLVGRISGKYMWGALKPALWSVPIIGVVALWCGSRLGFFPVRPGETLLVTAHFEDGASNFAHVVPSEALAPEGPAIARVQSGKAEWKLKAVKEGAHSLVVRHSDRSYEVALPVAARGGRPPDPVTVFQKESPTGDRLQAVEIALRDSLPKAWWNLTFQWGGWYIVTALVVALALRRLLGVQ
jgi:uncharacterized membrane protein (DUF106 family)